MKLYDYHRSSAAYRVRIAMNLKRLDYEQEVVNRLDGEQRAAAYAALNPQQLVPVLDTGSGIVIQSLAIIEYLDEAYPRRPLLSGDCMQRARQRAMAQVIACDVHPLDNQRVLNYLREQLELAEDQVRRWYARWITAGFSALERMAPGTEYLGGDEPMLPDVVLVPQMYNARRFEVPLGEYPKLVAICDRCNELDAFADAAPDNTGND